MKKILVTLFLVLISGALLCAQEFRRDTVKTSQVDTSLVGKSILNVLGSGFTVNQSQSMSSALERYVATNGSKKLTGYRIRVFYENGQSARNRSEAIARSISNAYPGIGVYRSFESPNFKVSVGDFRTRADALKVYQSLKATYPTALILKETINFPK